MQWAMVVPKGDLMRRMVMLTVMALAVGAGQVAYAQGYYRPYPHPSYSYGRPNPTLMPRGYIGFSGFGTGVLSQSGGAELIDNGGGVSVWGGVRFGPMFGLELNWTGSFHNPATDCIDPYLCGLSYLVLDI